MKRLTIHLKRVTPKSSRRKVMKDNTLVEVTKLIIHNTLSYKVKNEAEALQIVNSINGKHPQNNVSKWYLSNVY